MTTKVRADLVVAIPLTEWIPSDFLVRWIEMLMPPDIPVVTVQGAYVEAAHNKVTLESLEKYDYKYIWWLEQDTLANHREASGEKFPHKVLPYMRAHVRAEKLPIVGGGYFTRRRPVRLLGFHFDEESKQARHFSDAETLDFLNNPGPKEVGAVPMGCTLIRRDVLEAFPEEEPWFDVPTSREPDAGGGIMSDDVRFCVRARQLGFKVYLDSRIICEHVGLMRYDEKVWIAEARAEGRLAAPQPKPQLEVVRHGA